MATPINMSEPVRLAEVVPASLRGLRDKLRAAWKTTSIWDLGDQWHDCWYHRSRAWVLQSGFSRFGADDHSVKGAPNQGGDANWVAALDFALSDKALAEVYGRLEPAIRAGLLPQLAQLVKEPGHGHLSFWRSKANDDHTLLFQVMTGTAPTERQEDDMWLLFEKGTGLWWLVGGGRDPQTGMPYATQVHPNQLADYRSAGIFREGNPVPSVSPQWYAKRTPPLPTGVAGVDEKALAAELAPLLPKPLTFDETVAAVNKAEDS